MLNARACEAGTKAPRASHPLQRAQNDSARDSCLHRCAWLGAAWGWLELGWRSLRGAQPC